MKKPRKPQVLPKDACSALMTKTMTLNTEHRRSLQEHFFTADTAIFYCLRTMHEHGPDNDDVLPDTCRPGRECWCSDEA